VILEGESEAYVSWSTTTGTSGFFKRPKTHGFGKDSKLSQAVRMLLDPAMFFIPSHGFGDARAEVCGRAITPRFGS